MESCSVSHADLEMKSGFSNFLKVAEIDGGGERAANSASITVSPPLHASSGTAISSTLPGPGEDPGVLANKGELTPMAESPLAAMAAGRPPVNAATEGKGVVADANLASIGHAAQDAESDYFTQRECSPQTRRSLATTVQQDRCLEGATVAAGTTTTAVDRLACSLPEAAPRKISRSAEVSTTRMTGDEMEVPPFIPNLVVADVMLAAACEATEQTNGNSAATCSSGDAGVVQDAATVAPSAGTGVGECSHDPRAAQPGASSKDQRPENSTVVARPENIEDAVQPAVEGTESNGLPSTISRPAEVRESEREAEVQISEYALSRAPTYRPRDVQTVEPNNTQGAEREASPTPIEAELCSVRTSAPVKASPAREGIVEQKVKAEDKSESPLGSGVDSDIETETERSWCEVAVAEEAVNAQQGVKDPVDVKCADATRTSSPPASRGEGHSPFRSSVDDNATASRLLARGVGDSLNEADAVLATSDGHGRDMAQPPSPYGAATVEVEGPTTEAMAAAHSRMCTTMKVLQHPPERSRPDEVSNCFDSSTPIGSGAGNHSQLASNSRSMGATNSSAAAADAKKALVVAKVVAAINQSRVSCPGFSPPCDPVATAPAHLGSGDRIGAQPSVNIEALGQLQLPRMASLPCHWQARNENPHLLLPPSTPRANSPGGFNHALFQHVPRSKAAANAVPSEPGQDLGTSNAASSVKQPSATDLFGSEDALQSGVNVAEMVASVPASTIREIVPSELVFEDESSRESSREGVVSCGRGMALPMDVISPVLSVVPAPDGIVTTRACDSDTSIPNAVDVTVGPGTHAKTSATTLPLAEETVQEDPVSCGVSATVAAASIASSLAPTAIISFAAASNSPTTAPHAMLTVSTTGPTPVAAVAPVGISTTTATIDACVHTATSASWAGGSDAASSSTSGPPQGAGVTPALSAPAPAVSSALGANTVSSTPEAGTEPTVVVAAVTAARHSGGVVAPRRFSTRLATEQQSYDDIMQAMCMICLEKLSDPVEGGGAKLLGLLDSCKHRYCYMCILEWSKVTNKCPQCKARFRTIKAVKELRRGSDRYRGMAVTVADKDQTYDFVDVRDVVVLDPDVRCHTNCFLRQSLDARSQRGWEFSVQCEQCSNWFHGLCVGFNDQQSLPDRWFCRECGGEPYPTAISTASTHAARGSARTAATRGRGDGGRASGRGRGRGRGQQAGRSPVGQSPRPRPPPTPRRGGGDSDDSAQGPHLKRGNSGGSATATGSRSGERDVALSVADASTSSTNVATAATGRSAVALDAGSDSLVGSTQGLTQEGPLPAVTARSYVVQPALGDASPAVDRLRISVRPPPSEPSPSAEAAVSHSEPARTPRSPPALLSLPAATTASTKSPLGSAPVLETSPRATGRNSRGRAGRGRGARGRGSRGRGRGNGRGGGGRQLGPESSLLNSDAVNDTEGASPPVLPEPPVPSLLDELKASPTSDLCDICGFDTEPDNLIVYCESCNMGVHQTCYGISEIPTKAWFCSPCAAGVHPRTLSCRFCPVKGGALKRCTDDRWGHILCAFWIPECCFIDPRKMEPIGSINLRGQAGGVEQFLPSFRNRKCQICGTSAGCAIRCFASSCKFNLHPMCGSKAGNVYMEIETDGQGGESVHLVARCPRHHKGKGSVAGTSKTRSLVAAGADPLRIFNTTLEVADPNRNGIIALKGKVTWFDPISSRYCVVESCTGGNGEAGGDGRDNSAHWILLDKLVGAKATAVHPRKPGESFVVEALPSHSLEGGAAVGTAGGRQGGAGATGSWGGREENHRFKVEERGQEEARGADKVDRQGVLDSVVDGHEVNSKEHVMANRTNDSTMQTPAEVEVEDDPDATESEGEHVEAEGMLLTTRGSASSPAPSGCAGIDVIQDTPRAEQARSLQTQGGTSLETTQLPLPEAATNDDCGASAAWDVAESSISSEELTTSKGETMGVVREQEEPGKSMQRMRITSATSMVPLQPQQPQNKGVLRAVEQIPRQKITERPPTVSSSRYPLRNTRSRSHPESATVSSMKRAWLAQEDQTSMHNVVGHVEPTVETTGAKASSPDEIDVDQVSASDEGATSAKRPRLEVRTTFVVEHNTHHADQTSGDVDVLQPSAKGSTVVNSATPYTKPTDAGRSIEFPSNLENAQELSFSTTTADTPSAAVNVSGADASAVTPAYMLLAGQASMELLGQVPVMRVRSINVASEEGDRDRGADVVATYFASAYVSEGVSVEMRSSLERRRFSFEFEDVEELRKSTGERGLLQETANASPDLHDVSGAAMMQGAEESTAELGANGRKQARQNERTEVQDGGSINNSVRNGGAEHSKRQRDGEDAKEAGSGHELPHVRAAMLPFLPGSDASSTKSNLEDGEIELPLKRAVIMPPNSRDDMEWEEGEVTDQQHFVRSQTQERIAESPFQRRPMTFEGRLQETTDGAGPSVDGENDHQAAGEEEEAADADEDNMEISSSSDEPSHGSVDDGAETDSVSGDERDDNAEEERRGCDYAYADHVLADGPNRPVAAGEDSSSTRNHGANGMTSGVEEEHAISGREDQEIDYMKLNCGATETRQGGEVAPSEAAGVSGMAESSSVATATGAGTDENNIPPAAFVDANAPAFAAAGFDGVGNAALSDPQDAASFDGMSSPQYDTASLNVHRNNNRIHDAPTGGFSYDDVDSDSGMVPDQHSARQMTSQISTEPSEHTMAQNTPVLVSRQAFLSTHDPRLSASNRNASRTGRAKKAMVAPSGRTEKPEVVYMPAPPPPSQEDENIVALRRIVRQQLENVMKLASHGGGDAMASDAQEALTRIATDIERELFDRLFAMRGGAEAGERAYKAKYKQLLLSLGNVRNDRLVGSVLAGTTSPTDLATKDAVGLIKSLSYNLNVLAIPLAGRNKPGSPSARGKGKGQKAGRRGMVFLG